MNEENNENKELEINRRNREDYEQLMADSSTKLDGYWDKNNWFVRLLLLVLLIIIVVGCIVIFGAYFSTN
ncbi:MAG: hypothetical protein IKQ06_02340 [Bacilli bacterium]|nr:hypothetical protein [Bacilli bacterium]